MKKNISYEEAITKLESIVHKMESGNLDLDSLTSELKTAQELISLCKAKLVKTDNEIKKILDESN